MPAREEVTIEQAERALRTCLEEVPFLRMVRAEHEPPPRGERPDLVARVMVGERERLLVCEVTPSGQPRYARAAVTALARCQEALPGAYGVLIAPYIAPRAAEICSEGGIGCVDLAGNCRLSFDQVYIRREGRPNRLAEKRDLRSLYSPKAERVLRVLLNRPQRPWNLSALAAEAGVSLGQTHNVKELLLDREWLRREPDGLVLAEPEALLREWASNYRYPRHRAQGFYSLAGIPEIEAGVAEAADRAGIEYALTGFSGAARLAPYARYQRATAYARGDVDALARQADLKPVSSGANLLLLEPYDEGVFYQARSTDGAPVVSPVQLYLDLTALRGDDAAEFLLDQVLRRRWNEA